MSLRTRRKADGGMGVIGCSDLKSDFVQNIAGKMWTVLHVLHGLTVGGTDFRRKLVLTKVLTEAR